MYLNHKHKYFQSHLGIYFSEKITQLLFLLKYLTEPSFCVMMVSKLLEPFIGGAFHELPRSTQGAPRGLRPDARVAGRAARRFRQRRRQL